MQILLRQYDDKYYVWKEAEYKGNYFVADDVRYAETDIIAVKDGDGGKRVRCRECGELIENTPEAIEKHYAEQEAKRDCLKCRYMQLRDRTRPQRIITKNENGTYDVSETYTATLRCDRTWSEPDTETGRNGCIYNQHRIKGVETVGGVLVEYPDLFERQITVEALNAKGYPFIRRYDKHFVYDMGLRNTMYAHVNEYGIVDYFVCSYKYVNSIFYYSATQKKLFFSYNGTYREGKPSNWSDNKYNMVRRKIEALYKEGKAK